MCVFLFFFFFELTRVWIQTLEEYHRRQANAATSSRNHTFEEASPSHATVPSPCRISPIPSPSRASPPPSPPRIAHAQDEVDEEEDVRTEILDEDDFFANETEANISKRWYVEVDAVDQFWFDMGGNKFRREYDNTIHDRASLPPLQVFLFQ